jgi:hypothetical protein
VTVLVTDESTDIASNVETTDIIVDSLKIDEIYNEDNIINDKKYDNIMTCNEDNIINNEKPKKRKNKKQN